MSGHLRIRLLGPLVIERDGQPLPQSAWRSRQERRLLEILLTARSGSVSADRLIEWLWPGADPTTAAVSLRSAVSSLRRTLEPQYGARASSRYILTRPGGYAWNNTSGAWLDVDAFLAGVQANDGGRTTDDEGRTTGDGRRGTDDGGRTTGDGRRGTDDEGRTTRDGRRGTDDGRRGVSHTPSVVDERNVERVMAAVALYRGDYLEDALDAPWALTERERLRERYLNTLYALVEYLISCEEYLEAASLARQGLGRDPLYEPLCRSLMRAQALAGDTAGALRTYERYRDILDEALGAEPALQTRELHSAILRGIERRQELKRKSPGENKPNVLTSPPVAQTPPELPVTSPSPMPLVGREQELTILREWIDTLAHGRGGVVAIIGEAGIGKTRIVEEARRIAIARGALAITVRGAALERSLPFAQLSEALRSLLRTAPETLLNRLPVTALAQVTELLPVVRERLPELPMLPAVPPVERHNRLMDGLVDLALALAREGPLVLICDDAQWVDEATLATIGRLARRAGRRPLLIILAYRSEDLPESPALHTLLRTLARETPLRSILLDRLGHNDVTHVLATLAHTDPERLTTLALRLTERTGGNPLFLTVAIQTLLESRQAPSLASLVPEIDNLPLPQLDHAPQIRDLVLTRLEQLSEPARTLLEQLAVVNRPVSLDLVERLAGADALDAAQIALQRQFLAEESDGRLAFSHDVVRSIIMSSLSSPRRRQLHRQVAVAIAALHGDEPDRAAELVTHFSASGRGADAEILRYACAAGDHARRSFGYRQALTHYSTALRAAASLGEHAPTEGVRQAFAGRLLTYEALLDWDGIIATASEYDRLGAAQTPLPAPLITTRRLVLLRALMGDLAGAAAIGGEPGKQAARGTASASPIISDMLARTTLILRPAETDPIRDWTPFVPAAPLPGNPADELPALLGVDEATLTLFQIGWAALMQGLLDAAAPCLLRAYELGLETKQVAAAVLSALQLAHLHALRGDVEETERRLDQSLARAEEAPEAAWAALWPRIYQGFRRLLDDEFIQAQQRFTEMEARLADLPAFDSHRASVRAGLGLLALAQGNIERATTLLRAAHDSAQLHGFVYAAVQHGLARIAARSGNLVHARQLLRHTLDYSAQRCLLPEYVRTAIEIVRIERDFGEPTPTLPLLDTALDLARSAGLAPLATMAMGLRQRLTAGGRDQGAGGRKE
jgi:DNA-binding SARP family transcriptional activator